MKIIAFMTDKYCRTGKVIINDEEDYLAEVTDRKHGFKVMNSNKDIILSSAIYQPSRFHAFVGLGEHQFKDEGKIIGCIKYHGFLGLRRSVDVDGNISSLPRKHKFNLFNGKFMYDKKNHTVIFQNDNGSQMKTFIGICFYWLLRQCRMEQMD